jgi:large subunit ribosomal protein L29
VNAKELRTLDQEELNKKLAQAKEELFNLRFQMSTAQLDNPKRVRAVRRDIARIETIRTERELQNAGN